MEPTSLGSSKEVFLRDRAKMLEVMRNYFKQLDVTEVDCPILSKYSPVDLNIEVMKVHLGCGEVRYLHTSPEYPMKRLLSQGIGDIYQISHVYRDGEVGHLHNPEFTMVEWYRVGITYPDFIDEVLDFLRLFFPDKSSDTYTYAEMFLKFAQIDYRTAKRETLLEILDREEVPLPQSTLDRETLLQLVMNFIIEPQLGTDKLCVITDYPPEQAALAEIADGVAKRFEIYYKGIELANGYDELKDSAEQKRRFETDNKKRAAAGKGELPIDPFLLEALDHGLPNCCGVAVGFDRLMLLRHNLTDLRDMLFFHWDNT